MCFDSKKKGIFSSFFKALTFFLIFLRFFFKPLPFHSLPSFTSLFHWFVRKSVAQNTKNKNVFNNAKYSTTIVNKISCLNKSEYLWDLDHNFPPVKTQKWAFNFSFNKFWFKRFLDLNFQAEKSLTMEPHTSPYVCQLHQVCFGSLIVHDMWSEKAINWIRLISLVIQSAHVDCTIYKLFLNAVIHKY